jgi:hypothetical protein
MPMRDLYVRLSDVGRRFFNASGIPVPRLLRRLNRTLLAGRSGRGMSSKELEIEAQARAIERLETMAYLDRLGRRDET